MAKPGELNWDSLMKGDVGEPEHPFSRSVKAGPVLQKNKDGSFREPKRPTNVEISQAILASMPKQMRQPTSEEMIRAGEEMGLVKSKEEIEALEKKWENRFNEHFAALDKPVDDQNSPENEAWASGKSFNETLSEEERIARNMYIDPNE